jgi:hypothetical protein
MITNDARYTCEIKLRIAMAKAVLQHAENFFASKHDLMLKEKTNEILRLEHSFVWE